MINKLEKYVKEKIINRCECETTNADEFKSKNGITIPSESCIVCRFDSEPIIKITRVTIILLYK
jgi:hypothetical protein